MAKSKTLSPAERRKAPLTTPTDLGSNARRDITGASDSAPPLPADSVEL